MLNREQRAKQNYKNYTDQKNLTLDSLMGCDLGNICAKAER
jgi:hypothetical protein